MECQRCQVAIVETNFCPSKPAWCRPCYREYHREYREKNRAKLIKYSHDRWVNNKEKLLRQSKEWRETNHADRLEYERDLSQKNSKRRTDYMREYKAQNKEKIAANQKRYREKNKVKASARAKLNYHVVRGKISVPDHCSFCSDNTKVEAHHPDYTKPLEVEWLCDRCHKITHMVMKSKTIQ